MCLLFNVQIHVKHIIFSSMEEKEAHNRKRAKKNYKLRQRTTTAPTSSSSSSSTHIRTHRIHTLCVYSLKAFLAVQVNALDSAKVKRIAIATHGGERDSILYTLVDIALDRLIGVKELNGDVRIYTHRSNVRK